LNSPKNKKVKTNISSEENFTVEIYSLAIVLQHDRSFHDVFLDDWSDTNSGVLQTKAKILLKERNAKKIRNSIASVRVQFDITQVAPISLDSVQ